MGNVSPLFSSCPVFSATEKQKKRIQVKIKVTKVKVCGVCVKAIWFFRYNREHQSTTSPVRVVLHFIHTFCAISLLAP
jgi:hypothetical protein